MCNEDTNLLYSYSTTWISLPLVPLFFRQPSHASSRVWISSTRHRVPNNVPNKPGTGSTTVWLANEPVLSRRSIWGSTVTRRSQKLINKNREGSNYLLDLCVHSVYRTQPWPRKRLYIIQLERGVLLVFRVFINWYYHHSEPIKPIINISLNKHLGRRYTYSACWKTGPLLYSNKSTQNLIPHLTTQPRER